MIEGRGFRVQRSAPGSRIAVTAIVAIVLLLLFAPRLLGPAPTERMTILFIYILLAAMWNALAGHAGRLSLGQQLFLGLGGYLTLHLAGGGMNPFGAIVVAAVIVGVLAVPLSFPLLRLWNSVFAVVMLIAAEATRFLVGHDTPVSVGTGIALAPFARYDAPLRHAVVYWMALGSVVLMLGALSILLRGRAGLAARAIRDDAAAAASIGVRVAATRRPFFVLSAFGTALAGGLWLATVPAFDTNAFFSPNWTTIMAFMVLVGGLGTLEGSILGAIVFFLLETWLGNTGIQLLAGLGATMLVFALLLPRGIWGAIERLTGLQLLPVGYRLEIKSPLAGDN